MIPGPNPRASTEAPLHRSAAAGCQDIPAAYHQPGDIWKRTVSRFFRSLGFAIDLAIDWQAKPHIMTSKHLILTVAAFEGSMPDKDAVRECNAPQAGAVNEDIITYLCRGVRNCHCIQRPLFLWVTELGDDHFDNITAPAISVSESGISTTTIASGSRSGPRPLLLEHTAKFQPERIRLHGLYLPFHLSHRHFGRHFKGQGLPTQLLHPYPHRHGSMLDPTGRAKLNTKLQHPEPHLELHQDSLQLTGEHLRSFRVELALEKLPTVISRPTTAC